MKKAQIQTSGNYPNFVPKAYAYGHTRDAYTSGWSHGHGTACHNVPTVGQTYWLESEGKLECDAENIRNVHASLCHAAADNSRQYSPFEFTAHKFNSAEEGKRERLWEAFEAGTADAIAADLRTYTDDDYGLTENA